MYIYIDHLVKVFIVMSFNRNLFDSMLKDRNEITNSVNGGLEMPKYGGIKVLNSISTYLHLS